MIQMAASTGGTLLVLGGSDGSNSLDSTEAAWGESSGL